MTQWYVRSALQWTGGLVFAVSLAVFAVGIVRSPVIDDVLAQERVVLNKHARGDQVDMIRETRFAQAYWSRNSDVAAHAFFGAKGALGIFGAREHYDRHGRLEGRHWGL
jgi:hypothetical protein